MNDVNRLIKKFNKEDDNLYYIDLATPMLDPTGKPNRDLFIEDSLHLNKNGYSLWQSTFKNLLKKLF